MLTLQELKKITDMPGDREKLPTAKQLRITGLVVAQKQLGQEAEISRMAVRSACRSSFLSMNGGICGSSWKGRIG